jgi:hypothetical protein
VGYLYLFQALGVVTSFILTSHLYEASRQGHTHLKPQSNPPGALDRSSSLPLSRTLAEPACGLSGR